MIVRERIIFDENSVIIEFIGVTDNRLHRIRPDDTGNESVF